MARAKKAARGNRKSIQINNEREKRRMKRQLQRQDPKLNVTSEMIQSMSEQRGMGIIQSAVQINRPRNNYYASRNSPSAGNLKEKQTAFVRDIKNKLATIPYKPSKKNVCWLSDKQQQQDTDLSLTEELLQFAEFVAVSAFVVLRVRTWSDASTLHCKYYIVKMSPIHN